MHTKSAPSSSCCRAPAALAAQGLRASRSLAGLHRRKARKTRSSMACHARDTDRPARLRSAGDQDGRHAWPTVGQRQAHRTSPSGWPRRGTPMTPDKVMAAADSGIGINGEGGQWSSACRSARHRSPRYPTSARPSGTADRRRAANGFPSASDRSNLVAFDQHVMVGWRNVDVAGRDALAIVHMPRQQHASGGQQLRPDAAVSIGVQAP